MSVNKKQLPVKKKDELPAKNSDRTTEDTALVRKLIKNLENMPARYKVGKNNENEAEIIMPDGSDILLHYAKLYRAFATSSTDLRQHLISQLAQVFKGSSSTAAQDTESMVTIYNMAITILDEIRPRDPIETMLVAQMIGVHNLAIECIKRAMLSDQTLMGKETNVYQSTKLLRTFTQQMDTLKNYRRKGHQKVTVEHVNVNEGGQAIVGSVTKGGEE
ncbi:MAG: hypothetical protein Q8K00_00490 [Syntrophales bacterium]|nr:hypothetical protein [Syntrophales bacterium]